MSDREIFDCTWAGVAAALRVPEHTARRLALLAGLPAAKCRRMAPADRAALLAGIGLYRYSLHPGSRAERPCAYHADVAEFLGVHYATYKRWMRGSGLGAMLPRAAGRNLLLPSESAFIIENVRSVAAQEGGVRK